MFLKCSAYFQASTTCDVCLFKLFLASFLFD